jgi:hypothetical protein
MGSALKKELSNKSAQIDNLIAENAHLKTNLDTVTEQSNKKIDEERIRTQL